LDTLSKYNIIKEDDALKNILAKGIKKWNSVAEAMER
jgi:hypothetical protein